MKDSVLAGQRTDRRTTAANVMAATLPYAAIAAAGAAAHTRLALAHPSAALIALLWIVSDALMLALLARSGGRPTCPAVVAVQAGACCIVWLGAPPPLRTALLGMPWLAAAMAAIVLWHGLWGLVRARRAYGRGGDTLSRRWVAAASELIPARVARFAAAEATVLHMALWRWGGSADVPPDARAFAYHRHLTPICATLLILSGIEIAVYHLLVGHWSRMAAIVLFLLSDMGFVYLVGLIKSFRFRPILLTPVGVTVRAGFLIDVDVPIGTIAGIETGFAAEAVRDPATLNAALLAWPNVLLRLHAPLSRSVLGRRRAFRSIAIRLDDPDAFVRLLGWRLAPCGEGVA